MKKVFANHEVGVLAMAIMLMVLIVELPPHMAEGVTCNPVELAPCFGAISSSSPPSTACCQKVREQRPCLCGYIKNPSLGQYVNSPGARKVASSCGVPYPTC